MSPAQIVTLCGAACRVLSNTLTHAASPACTKIERLHSENQCRMLFAGMCGCLWGLVPRTFRLRSLHTRSLAAEPWPLFTWAVPPRPSCRCSPRSWSGWASSLRTSCAHAQMAMRKGFDRQRACTAPVGSPKGQNGARHHRAAAAKSSTGSKLRTGAGTLRGHLGRVLAGDADVGPRLLDGPQH